MRGARDVHEAIYSDVVATERTADAQVAQRNTVHRIFRLQIQWRIVWITTEGDGSARHELEVFLDYILYRELIHSVVHHIVAEHVEGSLVKPVGS